MNFFIKVTLRINLWPAAQRLNSPCQKKKFGAKSRYISRLEPKKVLYLKLKWLKFEFDFLEQCFLYFLRVLNAMHILLLKAINWQNKTDSQVSFDGRNLEEKYNIN